tara:strand:- start:30 stop:275 length:246 start_codon:yes stop_codon:yes gene_type:complete
MNNEKQQARHDIDVCKSSLRAVIKQVSNIKGSYINPMERVLEPLKKALDQLNEIYTEDWPSYVKTGTFFNTIEELEKIKIR